VEPLFDNNSIVLFQGDSITDAERCRIDDNDMGNGYAMMAAAWFSATYPAKHVRFINRGISGDCVADLQRRWQWDCIDLQPAWVSILVGINDVWESYQTGKPPAGEAFAQGYRELLTRAKETINPRLILAEPFIVPPPQETALWRPYVDPLVQAVRTLAHEFDAILVPLDEVFTEAATHRSHEFWAPDGVHPTPAGHALIAQTWLRAVNAL